MSRHLGDALSRYVDGDLDPAGREEVALHLLACAPCRSDVELLRGLKAALRSDPQRAPEDLAARLLALTATTAQPAFVPRPPSGVSGPLRRAVVGVGLVALGFGGAMAIAGPPSPPPAPVDPTSPGFVLEHASTANEVPFAGGGVVPVANPLPR